MTEQDEFDQLRERIEELEAKVEDEDESEPEYDLWYKFTHMGETRYAPVLEADVRAAPADADDHDFIGEGFAVYTDVHDGGDGWWEAKGHSGVHDGVDKEYGRWCNMDASLEIVDVSEVPGR